MPSDDAAQRPYVRGLATWSLTRNSRSLSTLANALLQRVLTRAGLAVAAGLMLAWLAPFGTGGIESFARIGYWITILALWALLSAAASLVVDRVPPAGASWQARVTTKFLLAIVPMVGVVLMANLVALDWRPAFIEIGELFCQVTLLGALFDTFAQTGDLGAAGDPTEGATGLRDEEADLPAAETRGAAVPPAGESRLTQRLPFHLRGAVLCLQMEDHYVRIHTSRGSALVLMRLTDAIDELDGVEGLRVHRSWWVAADACRDIRRSARTTHITLTGGLAVPVSRPYLDAVLGLITEVSPVAAAA